MIMEVQQDQQLIQVSFLVGCSSQSFGYGWLAVIIITNALFYYTSSKNLYKLKYEKNLKCPWLHR